MPHSWAWRSYLPSPAVKIRHSTEPATCTEATGIGTETRLPALVVSATRSERTLADQPMSVTVVPKEQILETPAQVLDDVLRTTVGINLPLITSYQIHPTGNSFSMRGLGGIRGLVMVDGVPINHPFFGYVQWSRVPMENIERVEVVRGASASMWGNYAMGGVVNIITRKPERTAFMASGGGGNYGTYRADGSADVVLSDAVKVRGNFNAWGTSGFNQIQPAYGPMFSPTSFNALNGQFGGLFRPRPDSERQPPGQHLQREPGAALAAADQQPAISTISPPT